MVLGVAIAVLAAGAYMITGRASAGPIGLEGVGDAGADPFADAIAVTEVPDVVEGYVEVDVVVDPDTGLGEVPGTDPALYGGLPDSLTCDVPGLAEALSGERAAAWASVPGVDAEEIDDYLAGLTPVILTVDTWVTGHAYRDGAAVPQQVVLQRGTSVLVDPSGVPRVKCLSGSPLLPPRPGDDRPEDAEGDRWAEFDSDAVAGVVPGDEVERFDVVDLTTGQRFEVPVGGSIRPENIALAANGLGAVQLGDTQSEVVQALSAELGEPDEQRSRDYGPGCRTVTIWWGWEDINDDALIAEFDASTGELLSYSYTNSGPDPSPLYRMATPEGLEAGMSVDEVSRRHPGATRRTRAGVTEFVVSDGYVISARTSTRPGVTGPYVETIAAGDVPCREG